MKKIGVFLLLCCLWALLLPGAKAANEQQLTYVTRGEYYDPERSCFAFPVEGMNNAYIYVTAANEMIVSQPVTVSADPGVSFQLYRDGEAVENPTEPQERAGSYALCVNTNGGGVVTVMSFTIISSVNSNLRRYQMPTGFQITGVTCNEERMNVTDSYALDFTEGVYRVTYNCTKTGVIYELCTCIDLTPPTLRLAEVNEKGVARSAVDISDVDYEDIIVLRRDGQPIAYTATLSDSGSYYIRVTDPAGNYTEYTFRIHAYLNAAAVVFFLIILAVVGGLLFYLMRERKHIRAR